MRKLVLGTFGVPRAQLVGRLRIPNPLHGLTFSKKYFSVSTKTQYQTANPGTENKKDIPMSPEERRNVALRELSEMKPQEYTPLHMKYALTCLNGVYGSPQRDLRSVVNLSFILRSLISYEKWISLGVSKTRDGHLAHIVATDYAASTGVVGENKPQEMPGYVLFNSPFIDIENLKAYCFNLDHGKPFCSISQTNFESLKYWSYWIKLETVLHAIPKNESYYQDMELLQLLSSGPICLIHRDGNYMMNEDGKILAFTGIDKPFKTFNTKLPGEILPVHNWLDLLARQNNVTGIVWNHLHTDSCEWDKKDLIKIVENKNLLSFNHNENNQHQN